MTFWAITGFAPRRRRGQTMLLPSQESASRARNILV
jgi:hypothetical protein